MRRRNLWYVLMLAIPLLLAGCFEYDHEVVINEDGSGTVRVHYNDVTEKIVDREESPPAARNLPQLPITKSAVVSSFGGVPLVVKDVEIKTVDGNPDVSYVVSFGDVEDLNGRGIFNLENGKFTQTFSLREDEGLWTYEHRLDFDWPLDEETYYGYYLERCDFTFWAKLPGEIADSNGIEGSDNTVRWEYDLSDLLGEEQTLRATYRLAAEAPPPEKKEKTGKPAMWSLGLIVLAAFIVVPIILWIKKWSRFLFMGAVLETLKKGSVLKTAVGAALIVKAAGIILVAVFLYLNFWNSAIGMTGLWRLGTFVYAVIVGVIAYMMVHATILRTKSIFDLPDNGRIIIPVMSRVFKLVGELVACALAAAAILSGGQGWLLLVAPAAKPADLAAEPATKLLFAGLAVVIGFVFLLISYLGAELVDIHGNAARGGDPPKRGDRPT